MVELHDLGFKGPPFTWHKSSLFERLDRALGSEAWIIFFPNSLITHLPKIKLDHIPLLNLNPEITVLEGWVEHTEFGDFVIDKGTTSESLVKFIEFLEEWNKSIYDYITIRKRKFLYKLTEIQRQMDLFGSNQLA
ncbi:Retrovirus-related Pol polyprotein LINE-1 [Gossypium australe]|uniref:Retrovirus-related Pol polyprotein LINE-1 n=1 Tax=Gossypium australe TaxID=47621 RepID=A0A5B6VKE4_9ROSI|nr:Retrovirus-related Pol polyprotein LINE-1 [Gossypium australe]